VGQRLGPVRCRQPFKTTDYKVASALARAGTSLRLDFYARIRRSSRVRKNARRLSFRSAGFARESGIHEHGVVKSMAWPVFLPPGLAPTNRRQRNPGAGPGPRPSPGQALTGRPGMTAEFFCTPLKQWLSHLPGKHFVATVPSWN
jgi:hypothetical protein